MIFSLLNDANRVANENGISSIGKVNVDFTRIDQQLVKIRCGAQDIDIQNVSDQIDLAEKSLTTLLNNLNNSGVDRIKNCYNQVIGLFRQELSTLTRGPRLGRGLLSAILGTLYEAKEPLKKQAILNYFFQYQHYNAEFSISDRAVLKYPKPLCCNSDEPGYIRTDYNGLFSLLKEWIGKNIVPKLQPRVKLCLSSSMTEQVLAFFFRDDFVVIRISPSELSQWQEVISKKAKDIKKTYLISLEIEGIDCSIQWVWKYDTDKKKFDFFDFPSIFDKTIFSLLNSAGAVPDRLEVNRFLSSVSEAESWKAAIKASGLVIDAMDDQNLTPSALDWSEHIEKIGSYRFEDDRGSSLYRDAVIRWHKLVFQRPEILAFAKSLLSSEVIPWSLDSSNIVEWSKAYQNLCEIVMLCIQSYPDSFVEVNLNSFVLGRLRRNEKFSKIYVSTGLYSYGMSSFFGLFQHFCKRLENERTTRVTCVSQNYFEILGLVEASKKTCRIEVSPLESLEQITELPDILVADIHPNNAAKRQLFQNNIIGWVKQTSERSDFKHLILILDLTLNDLSDPIVQGMLEEFQPLLENGSLQVCIVQSLAKLIQLGADNFSGGLSIYLGKKDLAPQFPASNFAKQVFFGLLFNSFRDIVPNYFTLIRKNTEWMYAALSKNYESIREEYPVYPSLTLNTDEETVYIALDFEPFFKKLKEWKKRVELKEIHKLVLCLANLLGLPITGRQSFGFSLSNINTALNALRFSIGIENQAILERYATFLTDFTHALSKYIDTVKGHEFDFNKFGEALKKSWRIVKGEESYPSVEIPVLDDDYDEDGTEVYIEIGRAHLEFDCKTKKLCLKIMSRAKAAEENLSQETIGVMADFSFPVSHEWNDSYLFKLFFHHIFFDSKTIFVSQYNRSQNESTKYYIGGFLNIRLSFHDHILSKSEQNQTTINLGSNFSVDSNNNKYKGDRVFFFVDGLGSLPVRFSKLDHSKRNSVFTKCMTYNYTIKPYDEESESVIVQFVSPKENTNYAHRVSVEYYKSGVAGVVEYLNALDINNLPLPHDLSWSDQTTAIDSLRSTCGSLGYTLVEVLTVEAIEDVNKIKHAGFRNAVIDGLFRRLIDESCNDECCLSPSKSDIIKSTLYQVRFPSMEEIEHWILNMNKYLVSEKVPRVIPYLNALMPAIQEHFKNSWSLCNTMHSIPLRTIGEKTKEAFPKLFNHILSLEMQISNDTASLQSCLNLYINYPMDEQTKKSLLSSLSKIDDETKLEWISSPDFYYDPLDHFTIGMTANPEDLIFVASDQPLIRDFFREIGCKELLLKSVREHSIDIEIAERWSKIINDLDLIQALESRNAFSS